MNKHLKNFLLRGFMFSGLGPIVLGIIYLIISLTTESFSLSGEEIFFGIISTYLLAFIQAGVSVFNQIENWPISKSILCHFSCLFVAYSIFYIGNGWIPFIPEVLLIFAIIFVLAYFIVWFSVVLILKAISKKLNKKL